MADVKITYETLFDLLRREKNRNELQQLDPSFYLDVVSYLKEKKSTIRAEEHTLLFSKGEQEKIKIQIQNIQKILKELYELREKKVINLSINKVRTESNLIDTSGLLPEEKSMFNETCELLRKYKEGVLNHVLSMELPVINIKKELYEKEEYSSQKTQTFTSPQKQDVSRNEDKKESIFDSSSYKSSEQKEKEVTSTNIAEKSRLIKVRVLNDLPKFMGQDKNIYGPYSKQAEVDLPEDITNILLKKGRVEVI
jgi:DNA replication initiation complex subunit (GINS family)